MSTPDLSALRIDPAVRRPTGGGGWRFLCGVLTLALLGVAWWGWRQGAPPGDVAGPDRPAAPPPPPAVTAPDPPPGREVLVASGYVVAHHQHELGSKVPGRVEWIGVEKSDRVTRGQLLVKLEDREYRAQLDQARAGLRVAEEWLAELRAGSRPEEIDRAKADLRRAEADRESAARDWRRLDSLMARGAASAQQADHARTRLEMAESQVRVADRTLALLRAGPREETIRQAAAEVARAAAMVRHAEVMLEATEIRAPIAGTVLRRIAEIGEMVTTSFAGESGARSAVVALADLDDLRVELDISQADFRRLDAPGLTCEMTPDAYPDRVYRCQIAEISPVANRQRASIQVKVRVLEPDGYLRPEMGARVTFRAVGEGG